MKKLPTYSLEGAAEHFSFSARHMRRILTTLAIKPVVSQKRGKVGHEKHVYLLGPLQMEMIDTYLKEKRMDPMKPEETKPEVELESEIEELEDRSLPNSTAGFLD